MLGILKRKHTEKEDNKEILNKVLPQEKNIPEIPLEPMNNQIKAPEIPVRPLAPVEQDIEPPFASWNDNVSDEEIPMPPPFMSHKVPERPPVRDNPMLPPIIERKIERKAPERPVQTPVENRPFRQSSIKGPVFLSLSKYQEVKSMLSDLKVSSAELRCIISDLKKNRDGGTQLLEQSVERLSTIENSLEEISATLRAG